MAYIVPSVLVQQVLANSGGVANTTPNLDACIIGPAYNVLTYTPGSLPSQVLTSAHSSLSTVGSGLVGSTILTVSSVAGFYVGDSILITGAGTSGQVLQTSIVSLAGNQVTLSTPILTAVVNTAVIKSGALTNTTADTTFGIPGQVPGQVVEPTSVNVWVSSALVETLNASFSINPSSNVITPVSTVVNLNSVTNTLLAEPGDKVVFSYTDNTVSPTVHVFTTSVYTLVTSSGVNGAITTIHLADTLPAALATQNVTVSIQRIFNDQAVLATNPLVAQPNLDVSTVGVSNTVTIKAGVSLIYGPVVSAKVFIAYRGLRTDLSNTVLTFNSPTDVLGQLGNITDANPLGLACDLAAANTTGRVRAIAVSSNDLQGYISALSVAEGERSYFLTPLTQDVSIIAAFKAHSINMSTPANAAWRITLANTAMPTTKDVGQYSVTFPSPTTSTITSVTGGFAMTDTSATFITDGVVPGDILHIVAGSGGALGPVTVLNVISNQQLQVNTVSAYTGVSYYITKIMTKSETAAAVASFSTTMGTSRVCHVQPDIVGVTVNGTTKYLPGYYLAAAVAGMGTGFAVQQGLTNVSVAGIVDLKNSNLQFQKADMNTMAAAGTMLFVQDTQGGVPYCRHELTTDMTTLNSRELLKVKELDYLSFFYIDILKGFIGSWNITASSLNTLRQTITAGSELLRSQSLPKVGPVLINYAITTLQQDPVNTDHVICVMTVSIGTPLNYIDLTLSV